MGIKRIVLTNYKDADLGAARVAGIIVGDDTIFWIHNKAYNWRNVTVSREKLSPVGKSFFYMYGAEDGVYEIRWYDTLTGEIVSSDASEAANGQVKVDVPGFSRDIACRIKKARSKVKE
jgi:hypothetical protein